MAGGKMTAKPFLIASLLGLSFGALVFGWAPPAPAASARSTGQLGYDLASTAPPAVTRVTVDGKARPALRAGGSSVSLSGVECSRTLPTGAVLVDELCCRWVDVPGQSGVKRLERRTTFGPEFPPRVRQEWKRLCTQRAGRRLGERNDVQLLPE